MKVKEISNEERLKIVDLCKSHSKEKGNCRVGWAANEIVGKDLPIYEYEKIVGIIKRDTLYEVSKKGETDFNITFVGKTWQQRHPYLDWTIKVFISAIITSLIGLLIALPAIRSVEQKNKEQDRRLDSIQTNILRH